MGNGSSSEGGGGVGDVTRAQKALIRSASNSSLPPPSSSPSLAGASRSSFSSSNDGASPPPPVSFARGADRGMGARNDEEAELGSGRRRTGSGSSSPVSSEALREERRRQHEKQRRFREENKLRKQQQQQRRQQQTGVVGASGGGGGGGMNGEAVVVGSRMGGSNGHRLLDSADGVEGMLDRFFGVSDRGSTVSREIFAGLSTFLTMSYIMLVNPQILAASSPAITEEQVVFATAIASGIACLLCGLLGNLPFGLAPGMGLSAYLSFGLVSANLLTTRQAYTSCFVAGALMGFFALTRLSVLVMTVIPDPIKRATIVGMGMLIAFIGFISGGVVIGSQETVVALGDLYSPTVWFVLFGLLLVSTLLYHEVPGGILLGVFILSVIYWAVDNAWPPAIASVPKVTLTPADLLDFAHIDGECVFAIVAFLCVGIFDVSGVVFGMGSLAGITEEDGHTPGSIFAFLGSAVGTMIAACYGCSPIIVHVESAAGIKSGGRTGLMSVTIGLLFLVSIFFAPLFGKVPQEATAPVLILVGALMMGQCTAIEWDNLLHAVPAFLTVACMPFTFSIPNGLFIGLGLYVVLYLTSGSAFKDLRRWRLGLAGFRDAGQDGADDRYPHKPDRPRSRSTSENTYYSDEVSSTSTPIVDSAGAILENGTGPGVAAPPLAAADSTTRSSNESKALTSSINDGSRGVGAGGGYDAVGYGATTEL